MKHLKYTGDREMSVIYEHHGQGYMLTLQPGEKYHLPEESGMVKHLMNEGLLTAEFSDGDDEAVVSAAFHTEEPMSEEATTGERAGDAEVGGLRDELDAE